MNENSIHLHHQMPDADDVKSTSVESMEESVELQLGLGVVSLMLVSGYRPETHRVAAAISTVL